jgi:ABC-type phosphate transport system substrate-binding protein
MRTKSILGFAFISLMVLANVRFTFAQTATVAVVVNAKNPVNNLSAPELRKLLAGEKHAWAGGRPVQLFVRGQDTSERAVLLKILGMSESEYKAYWSAQVFRGDAAAEPVVLPSNGMQREAVAAYPGAIALVSLQDVKPGMKIVKVDGHMPTEGGYPFN